MYQVNYAQHDIQILLEFNPGWHGVFFIAGREVSIERVIQSSRWEVYRADSLTNVTEGGAKNTWVWQTGLLGIGWSWPVARSTSLVVTGTYTFWAMTGGLKLRAGVRRFVL
ncbi:MAG: hypothetical protein PVH24_07535 [Candidatus Zixiibacteriota bacterium]